MINKRGFDTFPVFLSVLLFHFCLLCLFRVFSYASFIVFFIVIFVLYNLAVSYCYSYNKNWLKIDCTCRHM